MPDEQFNAVHDYFYGVQPSIVSLETANFKTDFICNDVWKRVQLLKGNNLSAITGSNGASTSSTI